MNVGIVSQTNYPIDRGVRIRKMSKILNHHGHEVTVFARNSVEDPERKSDGPDPSAESLSYASVRRFSWGITTSLFRLITAPFPLNPLWTAWLLLGYYRKDIEVVIVDGIRIGLPAIIAARLLGLPVVFDLQENHAEYVKSLPRENLIDHLLYSSALVDVLESTVVRWSDETFVVVEERRRALCDRGVPGREITVVSNTPYLAESSTPTVSGNSIGDSGFGSGFSLVYVGLITELRGLDLVVRALPTVNEQIDGERDITLVIAGDGPRVPYLKELAERLGVEEQVIFTGWIDSEDVPGFLAAGDIGVISHEVNAFTNTTVPNKLFDYMLVGIPVLVTDMAPVRRIVNETGCGTTLPTDATPEDVAEKIVSLANSDLERVGENGLEAVRNRYNWEYESTGIFDTLERFRSRRGVEAK